MSNREHVPGLPDGLTMADVAQIKGMLRRGDRQSDIAAFFGTNSGRIAEINTGQRLPDCATAPPDQLPPPGPYLGARSAIRARETLHALRDLLDQAIADINLWETQRDAPNRDGSSVGKSVPADGGRRVRRAGR